MNCSVPLRFSWQLYGMAAAVDFSCECIYGFSFSAMAALHVKPYTAFIYLLSVCMSAGFHRFTAQQRGSWLNEWMSVCVCSAEHVLVFHLGAATYVPYSYCMLPNNWHDYFLFNCSKANVDSNGSLLALLIYQFEQEKKSYFIYSTRIPLIKKTTYPNSHRWQIK